MEPHRPPTPNGPVAALLELLEREVMIGPLPPYLADLLGRFRALSPAERLAKLAGVYLCFEEYLADVTVAHRHSRAHLRSIVRSRFPVLLELPAIDVAFAEPEEQRRRLGEWFVQALHREAEAALGEQMDPPPRSSPPAEIEDLHHRVAEARGVQVAARAVDAAMAAISKAYPGLEHAVLALMPQKLLTLEWARAVAARRRELACNERFDALRRVNEELQARVAELDRDRAALVASVSSYEQSTSVFGAAVGVSDDGVLAVDGRGVILAANEAALHLWGCAIEEIVGKDLGVLLADGPRPRQVEGLRRYLETGMPSVFGDRLVVEGRRRDGTRFPARVRATETHAGERFYALVVRDLTEAHHAEAQLRLQAAALRSCTSGIAIADPMGRIEWTNPSFDAMTGPHAGGAIGTTLAALLDDAEGPPAVPWRGERVIRRRDGTTYVANLAVSPVHDEAGRVIHLVIHHDDITAEKRARESLRRSEASFRALIEQAPDVLIVAQAGKIVFVNAAAVTSLGHGRRDDMMGRPVEEIFPPEDRVDTRLSILRMETQGMPLAPRETALCRKDGGSIDADVVGVSVTFNGAPAAALIARDITERRRLQSRLAIADRTLALATLVAGVAHEINIPLANVLLSVEALEESLRQLGQPSGDALADQARRALEDAARARKIVKDLGAFAGHEPPAAAQAVDVQPILDASIQTAAGHATRRARFIRSYGTTPLVRFGEARLGQVFLTLLLDAVEEVHVDEGEHQSIWVRTRTDDHGRAEIEIADAGVGIGGRSVAAALGNSGVGPGFAIARSIVSAMGGELQLEAGPGSGTLVRMVLPPAAPRS